MEISNIPRVSIQEKHRLPATSGIYFVINQCGSVLYVGHSRNLKNRWRNHYISHPDWIIAYLETPNSNLRELEIYFIRKFLPPLNKQHCHSVYKVLGYRQMLLSLRSL